MPTPKQQEAIDAVAEHGSKRAAAKALGIHKSTLQERLDRIDPAIRDSMKAVGTDMIPALAWAKVPAKDGDPGYSVLLKPPPADPVDVLKRMVAQIADIPPAPRIEAPTEFAKGLLGLHVIADLHMGATMTREESGLEYNRAIAQERVRSGFAQCNAAMPACEVCAILYNGDTTHANDNKHRTPKSGHPLRVEGSHQSNIFAVEVLLVWQIDEALQKHSRVIVVIKPGNHDPDTPTALIMAMRARYRHNPRVTVIDDEDPYFVLQMGRVFLVSHHGDGAAPSKRALAIPHKFRREWGKADFHWFFSADKHHAKADTFGGLHWRQVPAVISLEQHANAEGYADTSGMYAAWFDTATGRVSQTEIRF